MALRWCLGKAKPAKSTSKRGWNMLSVVCTQATQICRQDQLGSHHHTPHSLPPEHSGHQLTLTAHQRRYKGGEAGQKAGRDCFLLRSLCDNIQHTLMVQWQTNPKSVCTSSPQLHTQYLWVYMHVHTNTYICIHTSMDSTLCLYHHRKAARYTHNITLQWW